MKKYQAMVFLLSTALTVSNTIPIFGASNDISGHWAEATIIKWQNAGKIDGYTDGTFQPEKLITRAEFVRLLNSALSNAFTSTINVPFIDVQQNDWFYTDVAKAVSSKTVSGFSDGTFRPTETVTRAQAAVLICNAKGLTPNDAAANNFTDVENIPTWAKGGIGAAVSAGYLSGYPDGRFGANKGMTRAEAISILDRISNKNNSANITQMELPFPNDDDKTESETINTGEMVWANGGGGTSKKTSSGGSSSNTNKYNNLTIASQSDANSYSGKTLTGTTKIYTNDEGINLDNIKFSGDIEIYAQPTVAAAYINAESNTAVAAKYSGEINVVFGKNTKITGNITIASNHYTGTQIVIKTDTAKTVRKIIANTAAKIFGFQISTVEAEADVTIAEGTEVNKIEAHAPIQIENSASVSTIEANTGTSVETAPEANVENIIANGEIENIVLNGTNTTNITINKGASVDTIVINNNANAKINIENGASIDNIVLNDSAKADIVITENATVETIISNSDELGTNISGDGDIGTIIAKNPETIQNNTDTAITKPEDNTQGGNDNTQGGEETKQKITASETELPIYSRERFVDLTTELEGKIIWSAQDEDGKEYQILIDEQDDKKAKLTVPPYVQAGTNITVTATTGNETASITIKIVVIDTSPVIEEVIVHPPTSEKIVKGGSGTFTFEVTGENLGLPDYKDVFYEIIVDGHTISNKNDETLDGISGIKYYTVLNESEMYITSGVKIVLNEDASIEEGKTITVKAISQMDNTKFGEVSATVVGGLEEEEKATLDAAVKALELAEDIEIKDLPAKYRKSPRDIEEKIIEVAKQIEGIKDVEGIDITFKLDKLPEDGLPQEETTTVSGNFEVTMLGVPSENGEISKSIPVTVLAPEKITGIILSAFPKPVVGEIIPDLSNKLQLDNYLTYKIVTNGSEATRWDIVDENGNYVSAAGEKFEAGKIYQAHVFLETYTGYEFEEEIDIKIIGDTENATISKCYVNNGLVSVQLTFPKTKEEPDNPDNPDDIYDTRPISLYIPSTYGADLIIVDETNQFGFKFVQYKEINSEKSFNIAINRTYDWNNLKENDDVTEWFPNMPEGVTATVSEIASGIRWPFLTIQLNGMPTQATEEPVILTINIPKEKFISSNNKIPKEDFISILSDDELLIPIQIDEAKKISSVGIVEEILLPSEGNETIGKLTAKDTDKYTVSATNWTKQEQNYTTEITFTAKDGYKFAETLPTLEIEGMSNISNGILGKNEKGYPTLTFTVTVSSSNSDNNNTNTPPSGDNNDTNTPPSGDNSDQDAPPSGDDNNSDTPPSGDDSDQDTPPSGDDNDIDTSSSGDDNNSDTPPSGDNSDQDTPPSGDDNNSDTPPSGDNSDQDTPPSGDDNNSDTPPSGDNNDTEQP